MKQLEVFLFPLDGILVHRRSLPRNFVKFPQQFVGTHLYTWVERGTVRVNCLVQAHNTMSPSRARTQTTRSGVERTNHEATAPPTSVPQRKIKYILFRSVWKISVHIKRTVIEMVNKVVFLYFFLIWGERIEQWYCVWISKVGSSCILVDTMGLNESIWDRVFVFGTEVFLDYWRENTDGSVLYLLFWLKKMEKHLSSCVMHRGYYMPAGGYEFYLWVFNSISHERAQNSQPQGFFQPKTSKSHVWEERPYLFD